MNMILFLILFELFSATEALSIYETRNPIQQDTLSNKVDSLKINIRRNTFYFKFPNAVLKILGHQPIKIDSIILSLPVDSIKPNIEPIGYQLELKDSTKLYCTIKSDNIQGLQSKNGRAIRISFFKDNQKIEKIFWLKASQSGNWIYWILVFLALVIIIFTFRKVIFSRVIKSSDFIYKKLFSILNKKEKYKEIIISKDKSLVAIQEELLKISKAISANHKDILNRFQQINLLSAKYNDIDKILIEKDKELERKNIDLANANQLKTNLELEIWKLKDNHEKELKALNDKIDKITRENEDISDRYQKIQKDYDLLKSVQNELVSSSIKITSIDARKLERYREVFRAIIKLSNDVSRDVLNLSFNNLNISNILSKIIANNFMINLEDIFRLRDDNEKIINYQRTENNLIRDQFPTILEVGFEDFDQKYSEIIFNNCISGKVDKMLIGLQSIYGLRYQIQISDDDSNKYDKMCAQFKSLENDFILKLKIGGFEPFQINLFDELSIQKTSFIETIGGLSLKEKFPFYEKKQNQRDLILEIAQWAYKKNGGLWKNKKALVKISI